MIAVRAPMRISFGGGGTDLEAYYARFCGLVLSAAIARYAYVVAGPAAEGGISITSADYQTRVRFPAGKLPEVAEPLALPKAALAALTELGSTALRKRGVSLTLASEVPPGTGLGSSSALAVALVRALAAYVGLPLSTAQVAHLACEIEIERLGLPIGKQDQYASAFGGLNTIEFRAEGVRVRPLHLPHATLAELDARLLLFDTGQSRHSASILRGQRADTLGNDRAVVARLHCLKALAAEMRDALAARDLDGLGHLMDRAWQEKRGLSGAISSTRIDEWYTHAREAGALGGKITGAGGGGYLLLYVPPRHQIAVRAALAERGLRELEFTFDQAGASLLEGTERLPGGLARLVDMTTSRPMREPYGKDTGGGTPALPLAAHSGA